MPMSHPIKVEGRFPAIAVTQADARRGITSDPPAAVLDNVTIPNAAEAKAGRRPASPGADAGRAPMNTLARPLDALREAGLRGAA